MSFAEIKQTISAMNEEERFLAAAYLRVLERENDLEWQRSMAERCDRIAEGRKVTLEQAIKMHVALESEGL
ncbi:MAG TPA: hypothetical protein VK993_12520 [Chthoniobacterales bacterium]|nr:hypothetical protein [Chthoniobacterales bacterium]